MVSDFLPIQKVRQTFGGQNYKKKGTLQTKIKKNISTQSKMSTKQQIPCIRLYLNRPIT